MHGDRPVKQVMLRNAWYPVDGQIGTEEANVQVRFKGRSAEKTNA